MNKPQNNSSLGFVRRQFDPAIRLMNLLKFPQKFALVSLLFIVPLALVMVLLILQINASLDFTSKEKDGIAYLRPLRSFYQTVLTGSVLEVELSGIQTPAGAATSNRTKIAENFSALEKIDQQLGARLGTGSKFQTLKTDWETLKSQAPDPNSGAIANAYALVIDDTRALLLNVANNSNLVLDSQLDSHYIINAVVVDLPEAQNRLAVGLATDIPTLAKLKSNVGFATTRVLNALLVTSVANTESHARIAFENTSSTSLKRKLDKPVTAFVEAAGDFTNIAGRAIGSGDTQSDTLAQPLYDAGLNALEASFQLWDLSIDELNGLLQTRVDVLMQQKNASLALTIVILLIVAYLFTAFYLAVMETVKALDVAAKNMVSGTMGAELALDNRDELGQIVAAFNKIASALVQQSKYRQAVVDNAADGILTTDQNGTILSFNPAAEQMFGYTAQEVIGQKVGLMVPAADEAMFAKFSQGAKMSRDRREAVGQRKDNSTFPLELAVTDTHIGDKQQLFIGLVRDITEVKRAEAALLQAKEAAEAASKMKGSFLANVSHELRTPLTSVLGFAKIIRKRLDDAIFPLVPTDTPKTQRAIQQVSSNVDIIIAEGERLTALINNVLDLAKIEAGKVEWHMGPLNISEIVERAASATAALFEPKPFKLTVQVEENLPQVIGDHDRLIQVVINLISNAVKFTEKGGITVRALREDNNLVVSVTDTGMGIAPKDHDKVFEQFVQVGDTLTNKPMGTGLGLPICKQIIEYHKGRIWLDSDIGKGSTFSFTLPISTTEGAKTVPGAEYGVKKINVNTLVNQLRAHMGTTAAVPVDTTGKKTILVVDDEASIRELLRQELESEGYLVREAKDGREALVQVKREKPDLIILDVMMPELSGFDVAAVLRNDPETFNIPIVILSIVQDKERGYRLGVDRYFTKPMDTQKLMGEIGSLLEQGSSKKKVLVVDEDSATVKTLADALQSQGYTVVEAFNGSEGIEKAVTDRPDMVIVRSLLSEKHNLVKTLRFEKGMENLLFLLFE